MNRAIGRIEKFIEQNRMSLLLIMVLIAAIGTIAGWRYYRYSKDAPEFCFTCHMMQESVISWQKSRHWNIKCQGCHEMGVLEQNRLLVAYVARGATGPQKQLHGRAAPWKSCRGCHIDAVQQGSLSVRQSFGHARHVFMENIGCENCHSGHHHAFTPDEKNCSNCHRDKLVHGLGMEGLSCLKCHNYGEKVREKVSMERCTGCHKGIPTTGVMSRLKCFDCHKPHKQISLASADCLRECHGSEVRVGQHRLHMERAKMECLDCHKAHTWSVGRRQARGLCDRCHPPRNPESFIY
jgi:hypothetical protein